MSRPEDQTQAYTQEQKIKALEVLSKKAKDPKQFAATFNALDDAGKKSFYDKAYSTFEELKQPEVKTSEPTSLIQDIQQKAVALPYKAAESASFGATTPLLAGYRTAKGELKELVGGPEIPIGQRYAQSKKDIQASSKAMESEQPFVSTVGNIAGYIPGLGVKALSKAAQKFLFPVAKKAPKLLEIGSRMFGEGVQGAIQEKGQKEKET
jgi:hypothetical protein